MTGNAMQFEDFVALEVQRRAQKGHPITERLIDEAIDAISGRFGDLIPTSAEDRASVRARLLARYQVTMELGVAISATHEPWIQEARRSNAIQNDYWDRYQKYLSKSLGDAVVRTIDLSTERIVDFFGNPLSDAPFQRRGLIMGDVQSGKTANYIALCCKAADAGYRLIILLTGTIEHLRKQTQERLDKGFVGRETGRAATDARTPCGVGLIDPRPQVQVLTNADSDFTITLATQANIQLDSAPIPTLLVTKKNQFNLANIVRWISQMLPQNGRLAAPVLVIDDEADNASVNTAAGDDPNRINGQIRELLNLGLRSTYVGITATPFANAFMRHDSEHAILGDDLFPRDFIYSLAPPSNYLGAARLFGDQSDEGLTTQFAFRPVDDAEAWLPLKHRIGAQVNEIPRSLREAICRFVVSTALRDIRGRERDSARAMMINVSRFTRVQDDVQAKVEEFLKSLKRDVEHYGNDPDKFNALENATALRSAYEDIRQHCINRDPSTSIPDWAAVHAELTATLVTRGIAVNALNSNNDLSQLSFKSGERRIVVGGNSLSRGITLEGLSVSYFYRKPLAKDTLLQMGRWFGYRDDYEDLCALFISDDARQLYADASETSDELRELVSVMNDKGVTPRYFGLQVRHHPGGIEITARNKMRHAAEFEETICFSGYFVESARMILQDAKSNLTVVTNFCNSLQELWRRDPDSGSWIANGIPKQQVAALVEAFRFHSGMFPFQPSPITGRSPASEMIRSASITTPLPGHERVDLSQWDVVIREGAGAGLLVEGIPETIRTRERKCSLSSDQRTLLIGGKRCRLGERIDEAIGVPKMDRQALERSVTGKDVSGLQYRNLRSRLIGRPLLIVSFVTPNGLETRGDRVPPIVVGLGLSFPYFNSFDSQNTVSYRINTVQQNLHETLTEDDDATAD